MELTYAWEGPNRAAVASAAANVATTNPSGDAQAPSAAQTLGGGGGGRGSVAVAGPAAPVAGAGVAAAARPAAARSPPHTTRGVDGAGALGGRPLAAPPRGAIVTPVGGPAGRLPHRLSRSVLPPSPVRWLETISAIGAHLIQVTTSNFHTKPDRCRADLELGRSSKISVQIDLCERTIVMNPHAIICSRLELSRSLLSNPAIGQVACCKAPPSGKHVPESVMRFGFPRSLYPQVNTEVH